MSISPCMHSRRRHRGGRTLERRMGQCKHSNLSISDILTNICSFFFASRLLKGNWSSKREKQHSNQCPQQSKPPPSEFKLDCDK